MAEEKGLLVLVASGEKGVVSHYVRPNGKCPSREFLDGAFAHLKTRYTRFFKQFEQLGMLLVSDHLFKPLTDRGKNLFVIKQHDHRFFCTRVQDLPGEKHHLVLLNGWVKDKDRGRAGGVEERREMDRALTLSKECQASVDWLVTPLVGFPVAKPEPTPQQTLDEAYMQLMSTPPPPEPAPVAKTRNTDEPLTTSVLANLAGVTSAAVLSISGRGLLPGFTKETGRIIWPWDKVDDLVAAIHKAREMSQSQPQAKTIGQHLKTPEGDYACPSCGRKFPTGGGAFAHSGRCKLKPKVDQLPLVAKTAKDPEITKFVLLNRFSDILDGKYKVDLFTDMGQLASQVSKWRNEIDKVEAMLRKLKGE